MPKQVSLLHFIQNQLNLKFQIMNLSSTLVTTKIAREPDRQKHPGGIFKLKIRFLVHPDYQAGSYSVKSPPSKKLNSVGKLSSSCKNSPKKINFLFLFQSQSLR